MILKPVARVAIFTKYIHLLCNAKKYRNNSLLNLLYKERFFSDDDQYPLWYFYIIVNRVWSWQEEENIAFNYIINKSQITNFNGYLIFHDIFKISRSRLSVYFWHEQVEFGSGTGKGCYIKKWWHEVSMDTFVEIVISITFCTGQGQCLPQWR